MTSFATSASSDNEAHTTTTTNTNKDVTLTEEIYQKLENGIEIFEKHLATKDVNADGNPWKLERNTGNIIVRYSTSNANTCRIFHVQFRVKIPKSFDLNIFISNLMDMPKRVSWDKSIKSAKNQ